MRWGPVMLLVTLVLLASANAENRAPHEADLECFKAGSSSADARGTHAYAGTTNPEPFAIFPGVDDGRGKPDYKIYLLSKNQYFVAEPDLKDVLEHKKALTDLPKINKLAADCFALFRVQAGIARDVKVPRPDQNVSGDELLRQKLQMKEALVHKLKLSNAALETSVKCDKVSGLAFDLQVKLHDGIKYAINVPSHGKHETIKVRWLLDDQTGKANVRLDLGDGDFKPLEADDAKRLKPAPAAAFAAEGIRRVRGMRAAATTHTQDVANSMNESKYKSPEDKTRDIAATKAFNEQELSDGYMKCIDPGITERSISKVAIDQADKFNRARQTLDIKTGPQPEPAPQAAAPK